MKTVKTFQAFIKPYFGTTKKCKNKNLHSFYLDEKVRKDRGAQG